MEKISFNDLILLNEALSDNQLNFRVHLRNVSNGQAIWIEPLGICACERRYDKMYEVIDKYFQEKGQIERTLKILYRLKIGYQNKTTTPVLV